MTARSTSMPENSITSVAPNDAAGLADLFAKGFRKTFQFKAAAPENRERMISWIEEQCAKGSVFAINDSHGPITLAWYDHEQNEVVLVVTRDDMEGRGYGERMLNYFADSRPLVKVKPITDSGRRLARKCGFSPEKDAECTWIRDQSEKRE